ncbi:hypothetical protein BZG36_03184 [Bifiguratus adelaidae]|uniref:Uncharacterized protein n=1 Tax=Bifiguratus adelaidae TaxID=1938954 RepID=A0A261XYI9_9FUNG|nr:hypothetical protein BZG36_03184 [Bifiguratus adelaidae]
MGITGLLPLLKSIHNHTHIREYTGQTIGVDGYVWLHRGALSCATELCLGEPTDKFVQYFMNKIKMLMYHDIAPIVVFDGDYLPSKGTTEGVRKKHREENREKGMALLKEGRKKEAQEYFSKAVDVTPQMAYKVILALKKENIQYVVAPYEADAQLTYLQRTNKITAIITEDSDLLAFGCSVVLLKLDQAGHCVEIKKERFADVKEVNLLGWGDAQMRQMCILSGCDYVASVPGLGLKKAHRLLRRFNTAEKAIKFLRLEGQHKVPRDYEQDFQRAELTFLFQRVYDMDTKFLVTVTPLPPDIDITDMDFLGPLIKDDIAHSIAIGDVDPISKKRFVELIFDEDADKENRPPIRPQRMPHVGAFTQQKSQPLRRPQRTIASYFAKSATKPLDTQKNNEQDTESQPNESPQVDADETDTTHLVKKEMSFSDSQETITSSQASTRESFAELVLDRQMSTESRKRSSDSSQEDEERYIRPKPTSARKPLATCDPQNTTIILDKSSFFAKDKTSKPTQPALTGDKENDAKDARTEDEARTEEDEVPEKKEHTRRIALGWRQRFSLNSSSTLLLTKGTPRYQLEKKPTLCAPRSTGYDVRVCLPQRALQTKPPSRKAKAAFVVLVRNSEQESMTSAIRNLEERFNRNFHYPYVFLNDEPFTPEFKEAMHRVSDAEMEFGLIPEEHWSYPAHVNQTYAAECRERMEKDGIYYGGSETYRHMCRFNSGFFFRHPLLDKYDWYWRVEPGVKYYCDITYDPFIFMEKHNKLYGFVITLTEIPQTIPSLWQTTLEYARLRRLNLEPRNPKETSTATIGPHSGLPEPTNPLFPYFRQPNGDYNLCHFWSNFEIASLNLWRSPQYMDYFNYLDKTGNFFYERWGDAPVHSLAAGLFLSTEQIHYFEDIGYQHDWYRHCPSKESKLGCNCDCPTTDTKSSLNHDLAPDTCLPRWRDWIKKQQKKSWTW